MKKTGIILVLAIILTLSKDGDADPVRRHQLVAVEHQRQRQRPQGRQEFLPWYPEYPEMTGYQAVPPFLPAYPNMQYEGANYYPLVIGLEDPYDYEGSEQLELFRNGQKKHGRKRHPAQ